MIFMLFHVTGQAKNQDQNEIQSGNNLLYPEELKEQ